MVTTMPKYINAETLTTLLLTRGFYPTIVKKAIEDCPESDVEEVRHGEWEAHPDDFDICATEFVCSVCKESFVSSELTDEIFLEMLKYCPNCGSKMDGERR